MKILIFLLILYPLTCIASEKDNGKSDLYTYSITIEKEFDEEEEIKPRPTQNSYLTGKRILTGVVVAAAAAGIYFCMTSDLGSRIFALNSHSNNIDMGSKTLTRSNSLPTSFAGVTPPSKENFTKESKIPNKGGEAKPLYSEVLMKKNK